ncbi:hypothetical protein MG293_006846 [Ovis ammon polii]|uniref:Uncharacterized protein n=1 Tax=Ovis ammon polii TaxID=230172 RepID=A0AAD4UFN4_OVIAM|nr:hypothetical protein MG293_006846 [Ovis ammon polii]KAI4572188.1 hypothetical protein MJT46_005256 [Ovis ammon polii x Ovis aries]
MRSTSKREGKSLKDAGPSWSHQMLKALPGSLNLHRGTSQSIKAYLMFHPGNKTNQLKFTFRSITCREYQQKGGASDENLKGS